MSDPFDLSKKLSVVRSAGKWTWVGWRLGRQFEAAQVRRKVEAEYDPLTAEAAAAVIASNRNPRPIQKQAKRRKTEAPERERLLSNPPQVQGSATWVTGSHLSRLLSDRSSFDNPSLFLLGTLVGALNSAGFVHRDDGGHPLTPARGDKSVTAIISNLLRYRSSAVVLDPEGELL